MHATRISVKLFSQKWQKITMMSPEIFQNPGPFLPRVQRIFTLWGNWKDARQSNHVLLAQLLPAVFNWMQCFPFPILKCC